MSAALYVHPSWALDAIHRRGWTFPRPTPWGWASTRGGVTLEAPDVRELAQLVIGSSPPLLDGSNSPRRL